MNGAWQNTDPDGKKWAFVIHGPDGEPIKDHKVYFAHQNDAQASAWRRGLDSSAGYSVKEIPYREEAA
jgi:hypothetical protein